MLWTVLCCALSIYRLCDAGKRVHLCINKQFFCFLTYFTSFAFHRVNTVAILFLDGKWSTQTHVVGKHIQVISRQRKRKKMKQRVRCAISKDIQYTYISHICIFICEAHVFSVLRQSNAITALFNDMQYAYAMHRETIKCTQRAQQNIQQFILSTVVYRCRAVLVHILWNLHHLLFIHFRHVKNPRYWVELRYLCRMYEHISRDIKWIIY